MPSWRWIPVALLLCGVAGLLHCSGEDPSRAALPGNPDEDFQMTMDAFTETEDPEGKAALWLSFLERNPSNGYTVGAVEYLATQYYMGFKKDPDAAIAFVRIKLSHLDDPELAAEGQRLFLQLLGEAGRGDELAGLVREMEKQAEFGVEDEEAIYRAAIAARSWELAGDFSAAAVEGLDERIKDPDLDEEELESVREQRSAALISLAWARSNLGQDDQALALFDEAEKTVQFDYNGFSSWPTEEFDLYHGKTLLATGKVREAISRLAPRAVILEDPVAVDVLAEAHRLENGSADGFSEFVEETRYQIARDLPDFTVTDYNGNKIESSSLRGKVTLLAFWFPT